MRINLIAVGSKMPPWVTQAYQQFAERMPTECQLQLIEIPLQKRNKNTAANTLKQQEAEKIKKAIPKNTTLVALDVNGKTFSTEKLASQLENWMMSGKDVSLLVGGPDGLSEELLAMASLRWSLSTLTFPHPLVRVILAEQLYRAYTITINHPYHRAD